MGMCMSESDTKEEQITSSEIDTENSEDGKMK